MPFLQKIRTLLERAMAKFDKTHEGQVDRPFSLEHRLTQGSLKPNGADTAAGAAPMARISVSGGHICYHKGALRDLEPITAAATHPVPTRPLARHSCSDSCGGRPGSRGNPQSRTPEEQAPNLTAEGVAGTADPQLPLAEAAGPSASTVPQQAGVAGGIADVLEGSAETSQTATADVPSLEYVPRATLECSICYEDSLQEVGQLDCCCHSFCPSCIQDWSNKETRCPVCRERFSSITHKLLDVDALGTALAAGMDLPGVVLETRTLAVRDQAPEAPQDEVEQDESDPLWVQCLQCSHWGPSDMFLWCGECDRPCHLVCADLDRSLYGSWPCPSCYAAHLQANP